MPRTCWQPRPGSLGHVSLQLCRSSQPCQLLVKLFARPLIFFHALQGASRRQFVGVVITLCHDASATSAGIASRHNHSNSKESLRTSLFISHGNRDAPQPDHEESSCMPQSNFRSHCHAARLEASDDASVPEQTPSLAVLRSLGGEVKGS